MVVKPFDSWDLNFLYVVNESTILSAFLITIAFMLNYNEEEGKIICTLLPYYLCSLESNRGDLP